MKFNFQELKQLTTRTGGAFKVSGVEEAYSFCQKIATRHYENFPVGSLLIPSSLRHFVFAVYSFARIADDIADEHPGEDNAIKLEMLDNMIDLLDDYDGNPIFLALADTIANKNLPKEPFIKLIQAFKWDVEFIQSAKWEDLLVYSDHSANPIGEIILYLFSCVNKTTKNMSDHICTGLQLINFWQDLSVDIQKNRHYIPVEILEKFNLDKENLLFEENSAKLLDCLNYIYDLTEGHYEKGRDLPGLLKPFRLKAEMALTIEGGKKILEKIRRLDYNIFYQRPVLNKMDFVSIILNSFKNYNIISNGHYKSNASGAL